MSESGVHSAGFELWLSLRVEGLSHAEAIAAVTAAVTAALTAALTTEVFGILN